MATKKPAKKYSVPKPVGTPRPVKIAPAPTPAKSQIPPAPAKPKTPIRTPVVGPTPTWDQRLTGDQRNAYAALQSLFKTYGLDSLAPRILEYVQKGYEADTVSLLLQDTTEWKQRFIGNEARVKAGLKALTPSEYLALEDSYKQTMRAYSMPAGFWDQPSDFAKLMSNQVSPDELRSRAASAWQFVQNTSSAERQKLRDYYGIDDAQVAAYFLDPEQGQAVIEKRAAAAGFGGIASRQGFNVGRQMAETWVDQGVSQAQVTQGAADAAGAYEPLDVMGRRYGQRYTQDDAMNDFVGGLASARRKRQKLAENESASFSGATGTASFSSASAGDF